MNPSKNQIQKKPSTIKREALEINGNITAGNIRVRSCLQCFSSVNQRLSRDFQGSSLGESSLLVLDDS